MKEKIIDSFKKSLEGKQEWPPKMVEIKRIKVEESNACNNFSEDIKIVHTVELMSVIEPNSAKVL